MADYNSVEEIAYRAAYINALRRTPDLGELQAVLSTPQVLRLTGDYVSSPLKVMIMGQETAGNYSRLADIPQPGDDWAAEEFARQVQADVDFDFAYGKEQENSRWWRAFGEVCEYFGLPSRRYAAWSNISKVQLVEDKGNGVSISQLSSAEQVRVRDWQKALLQAELAYAKPDILVMMTGGLCWIARQTFVGLKDGKHGTELPIPGVPDNTMGLMSTGLGATVAGFTLHPASRLHTDDELRQLRAPLLDWLARRRDERLSRRR